MVGWLQTCPPLPVSQSSVPFPPLESGLAWDLLRAIESDGKGSVLVPSLGFGARAHQCCPPPPPFPFHCSSQFNLKPFMSYCDPHPVANIFPYSYGLGFWNPFGTRGPLDGHVSPSPSEFLCFRTISPSFLWPSLLVTVTHVALSC